MKRGDDFRTKLKSRLFGKPKEHAGVVTAMRFVIYPTFEYNHDFEVRSFPKDTFVQVPKVLRKLTKNNQLLDRGLRSVFEEIDAPYKLEQFLKVCGPFKYDLITHPQAQWLDWTEFQDWQTFMRELQQGTTPTSVQADSPEGIHLTAFVHQFKCATLTPLARQKESGIQLECFVRTALEVVAATIAADLLAGTCFKKCDGCDKLRAVESRHHLRQRAFCNDNCRQKAWQRENRKSTRKDDHAQA